MHVKSFSIENFKSLKKLTIDLNADLNIFTGSNNSGKTTVLEAVSLWHECFSRLLQKAKRGEKNYKKGNWILGPTWNKYFPFDQINSVRNPNFEDIFFDCDKRHSIRLSALLSDNTKGDLTISFKIGQSGMNYVIELDNFTKFDFSAFNNYFSYLPEFIGIYYASPVSSIRKIENFVTGPQIKDRILKRESALVLRNRLYNLIKDSNSNLIDNFCNDISYILFDKRKKLCLDTPSSVSKDTRVVVNYSIDDQTERDISLLGSGSLQAIEILLNMYQPGNILNSDFNLVLLDEPDSHIHRDIQNRLIEILSKFSNNNQIFISTHNEMLIRASSHRHLFHLDGRSQAHITNIDKTEVVSTQPHFKGIYPSKISPVIRSVGNLSGLDFINAIECDKLIFVEGEDDARVINILFQQLIRPTSAKRMFWVLGGISEVFENITGYKAVFTSIKNGRSLWEKSALIFDKDFLCDKHKLEIAAKFKSKLGIEAFSWNSYTFESTIFTDLPKLSQLVCKYISTERPGLTPNQSDVLTALQEKYNELKDDLRSRLELPKAIEDTAYRYKNVRNKIEGILDQKIIKENDIQLTSLVKGEIENALNSGSYYKLMNKDDVGLILDKVVSVYGMTFSIETDFIELIKCVDKSLWFDEWNFLNQL